MITETTCAPAAQVDRQRWVNADAGAWRGTTSSLLPALSATLWEDNPDLTASLRFFFTHTSLVLDVVPTAESLLVATQAGFPDGRHFLIVDCTTLSTALARATMIVTHTTMPVYICHARKGFVEDLQASARGPVLWLPPDYTGLALLDKLRGLRLTAESAVTATDQPDTVAPVLTPREQSVHRLVARNLTNAQIAARLGVTENTVKSHLAAIKVKLGLHTRRELITGSTASVGELNPN